MKRNIAKTAQKGIAYTLCVAMTIGTAGCGNSSGVEQATADTAGESIEGIQADVQENADGQSGAASAAADGTITYTVHTDTSGLDESHQISDTLFGLFLEDINYAVDGGMYVELIKNRSFEYGMEARDAELHGWDKTDESVEFGVTDGSADGTALNEQNPHYAVISNPGTSSIKPYAGISNGGYIEGMAITEGAVYDVSFYCKAPDGAVDQVHVMLCNEDGTVYDEQIVEGITSEWMKYETTLTAPATANKKVQLAVEIPAGTACFDMISMMPQETYKDLPVRKDFGEYLEDLNPTFLRFPGGCVVEGRDEESIYSWKDSVGNGLSFTVNGEVTVGDVATRPQGKDIWQGSKANPYYMTYGLGFYEYFELCEALECMPVPVLNAGMTCEIQSPFYEVYSIASDEFKQYVQDALDLVEFCKGDESTVWGAVRIAMGHSDPFDLKYVAIGNEQWQTEYHQHYKQFVKAFEEAAEENPELYGDIELIVANGTVSDSEDGWNYLILNPDSITTLVDEHYYQTPEWFLANTDRYDSYDRNSQAKVFLGEYAAKANTLDAALAEAAYMTGLEKNGDVVAMACYAPLFANVKLNQWQPDMIFYSNDSIFASANYYVQQLYGTNAGTVSLPAELAGAADQTLYESAVCDENGDVILKLVNVSGEEIPMNVSLDSGSMDIGEFMTEADVTVLTGENEKSINSMEKMEVVPEASTMEVGENFRYTAPPYSLTVIRMKHQ